MAVPAMPTHEDAADEPGDERADDASVIRRSWDDARSFAAIFDRHAATVHRYVARRAGAQLADDVTAETFAVALDRRRRYDLSRRNALPWLYGIATNLLRQHRRAELRQYRALARTGVDPVLVEGHADVVSARVTAAAMTRELAAALARLSSGERDVLLLHAWADLTHDEIASALDIAPPTVRSRLHRARTKIRNVLEEQADE